MRKNPLSNMSAHGGIITSEFLEIIRSEKVVNPRVEPESFAAFGVPAPKDRRELAQQIDDAWNHLRERWDAISNRYVKMNVSDARSKWMIPLLKELGFDPAFNKEDIVVDEADKLRFRLSHRGLVSSAAPMLHLVGPSQDLEGEASEPCEGVRRRSRSPHDELQAFLNVNRKSKWGIVTNGILLRILREYYHTTTKGYVEFDLENIFRERSFTDFRALYRMAHASRFIADKDGVCALEQFYEESVTAGVTVGENLRRNVKKAIEALGNGFLTPQLAKKMVNDEEFCKSYYAELLKVVYRLLFLLFAEQRAMLPTRDSLYAEEYSVTRLREMAETRHGKDEHLDLWEGLKITFQMLKTGCQELKVFGYNGSLFDDTEIPTLSDLSCKNQDVLAAVRNLTLVEEERVLKRINYLDLGVEEIGSIYESLLDFMPRVFDTEQEIEGEKVPANVFFLDPRSVARKATGSYYTSRFLIDELIKNALKPVVEDKLSKEGDKEKDLLSIKVCDPACGSGAFLIAANNYLAKELAKVRTGYAEPPDAEIRKAARDVCQHCIYGVDLNSMAVELAKVSLWINACLEDLPLNFLDHHIKWGNSLLGATEDLLKKGIPDVAYVPMSDEEKTNARNYLLTNRKQRDTITLDEVLMVKPDLSCVSGYEELSSIEESKIEDVELKKLRYASIVHSQEWRKPKLIADAWIASFFWSMRLNCPTPPTTATLRLLNGNRTAIAPDTMETIQSLSNHHRFFHWRLEFPDVFSRGSGFDVILGNPPFMGGWKIRGTHGDKFNNFMAYRYEPTRGRADLCAYFYRLAFSLLREDGHLGMVATKTIGQGETRETGLSVILKTGGEINFARRFVKWPGTANVEVNLLAIRKGHWRSDKMLDDAIVPFISSRLDESSEQEERILEENRNKSFAGDALRGMGFVIDVSEAKELLLKNEKNAGCLYRFLNGEDLNGNPRQESDKYVICFHDWPLEKAMQYPSLLEIVQERVKPERDKVREKRERENWWLFARYRGELREAIKTVSKVMIRASTSEHHMVTFSPKDWIYSHAITVFTFDDGYHFSIVQSGIHEIWLRRNASTLRTDIRYTPTTCFETFPFPDNPSEDNVDAAMKVGLDYHDFRRKIMNNRNIGLTQMHNLIHDPDVNDEDIRNMRQLATEMDLAVLKCYGWHDIDAKHGFYENERGKTRFSIWPEAKKEILKRLLKLNERISKED